MKGQVLIAMAIITGVAILGILIGANQSDVNVVVNGTGGTGSFSVTIPIANVTNLIGSKQCGGTDKVVNVTVNNSGLFITCAADATGNATGGGGAGWSVNGNVVYNDTSGSTVSIGTSISHAKFTVIGTNSSNNLSANINNILYVNGSLGGSVIVGDSLPLRNNNLGTFKFTVNSSSESYIASFIAPDICCTSRIFVASQVGGALELGNIDSFGSVTRIRGTGTDLELFSGSNGFTKIYGFNSIEPELQTRHGLVSIPSDTVNMDMGAVLDNSGDTQGRLRIRANSTNYAIRVLQNVTGNGYGILVASSPNGAANHFVINWHDSDTVRMHAGSNIAIIPSNNMQIVTGGTTSGVSITNTLELPPTSSFPLEVRYNRTGISIWSQGNVSASGYITRTEVFKGSAIQSLKNFSSYLLSNGTINHTAFGYSAVSYIKNVTVGYANRTIFMPQRNTSRLVPITEIKTINGMSINVTIGYINQSYIEPAYSYIESYPLTQTVIEQGVSLDKEVAMLKQALYELKTEICKVFPTRSYCLTP